MSAWGAGPIAASGEEVARCRSSRADFEISRSLKVLVAGGVSDGLVAPVLAALLRDARVESADSLSEPAEAWTWVRFGGPYLVVLLPDAGPLPEGLADDLLASGCVLAGVYMAGESRGKESFGRSELACSVAIEDDFDESVGLLLDWVVANTALGSPGEADRSIREGRDAASGVPLEMPLEASTHASSGSLLATREEPVLPRRHLVVVVVSLGASAGATTLAASLGRISAEGGNSTALLDLDPCSTDLSRWLLGSQRRRRRRIRAHPFEPKSGRPGPSSEHQVSDGQCGGMRWDLCRLASGAWLARAGFRADLRDPSEQATLELVGELTRRFEVTVVDAGNAWAPTVNSGESAPRILSRFAAGAPDVELRTLAVCRADPPGVERFIRCWAEARDDLEPWGLAALVLNGLPTGVRGRSLESITRSLARATSAPKVLAIPFDQTPRTWLWDGSDLDACAGRSSFVEAVRSLAETVLASRHLTAGSVSGSGVRAEAPGVGIARAIRRWRGE